MSQRAHPVPVVCESLEGRRLLAADFSIKVNFQPKTSADVPVGHYADVGRQYALRRPGVTFGWSQSNESEARDRNATNSPDQRYDTFNHLLPGNFWALAVPNGTYQVRIVSGDPNYFDSRFRLLVEGVIGMEGTPTSDERWVEGTTTVTVTDGNLTIKNAAGSANNKLNFIEVTAVDPPAARPVTPTDVSASVLTSSQVRLTWTDAADAETGYTVERRIGGLGQTYQTVGILGPGATRYTDERLAPGVSYVWRVRAINAAGASDPAVASARTIPVTGDTIRWTTGPAGPIIRAEALTAAVGGKIYVFGGFSGDDGPVRRSDVYDPRLGTWTRIADLPTRLTHAGVAVVGRDVYVAGGYVGIGSTGYNQEFGTQDVWRYDVDADEWFAATDLPDDLAGGGLVALGRKLHYFGGNNDARNDVGGHYVLDLDDTDAGWQTAASLPVPRSHMGYVESGGKIYAVVGQTGNDAGLTTRANVHVYDPATDEWTALASAPRAVSHVSSSTIALGGRILVFGGETDHEDPTAGVMAYDIATNTWDTLNNLPAARFSGVARAIDGIIHFTSGSSTTTTYRGVFV